VGEEEGRKEGREGRREEGREGGEEEKNSHLEMRVREFKKFAQSHTAKQVPNTSVSPQSSTSLATTGLQTETPCRMGCCDPCR
jgi:hypothetical protein